MVLIKFAEKLLERLVAVFAGFRFSWSFRFRISLPRNHGTKRRGSHPDNGPSEPLPIL
jgi:hypothetical protein